MYLKSMRDMEEFGESPADGEQLKGVRLPEEAGFATDDIKQVLA